MTKPRFRIVVLPDSPAPSQPQNIIERVIVAPSTNTTQAATNTQGKLGVDLGKCSLRRIHLRLGFVFILTSSDARSFTVLFNRNDYPARDALPKSPGRTSDRFQSSLTLDNKGRAIPWSTCSHSRPDTLISRGWLRRRNDTRLIS